MKNLVIAFAVASIAGVVRAEEAPRCPAEMVTQYHETLMQICKRVPPRDGLVYLYKSDGALCSYKCGEVASKSFLKGVEGIVI